MITHEETPLRVGLIGTGYIGTAVGRQFHHHPESTVSAIMEIDADRRESAANTFSVSAGSPVRASFRSHAPPLRR